MGYRWKPLQRAEFGDKEPEAVIVETMKTYGVDRAAAIAKLDAYNAGTEVWINDIYQVQTRRFTNGAFGGAEMIHLNIRRRDGGAVFDWRHRQQIKTELVGAECEAFEIYPAESRLVDTSNKYHLWAFVDPTIRLPVEIGRGYRDVVDQEVKGPPGLRQRGL